jgi:MFS family permease
VRTVIANSGFRRLWLAQVVLALGDACMRMGLLEFLRVHGMDVRVEAAKILFAVSLPGALLGPVAVAVLDRWQRRSVLMISDALRMLLVVVIAVWLLPVLTGRLEARGLLTVYGMMFLIGAVTTFSYPARYALIPNLVDGAKLVQANTLLTTSLAVANGAGLPVGGFIAEKIGVHWALCANALAYLASIMLVWGIRMRPHATSGQHRPRLQGSWPDLKDGLLYLWRHPSAAPLTFLSAVFAFLLGIFIVAIVGYAVQTLELAAAGFAYLGAGVGVGAAIGVVTVGRGKPWTRSDWLPVAQLVLLGLLLGALGMTRNVWVAAGLLVAVGAVGATVLIPIDSKLQGEVDDARRGAVFAARGVMTSLAMVTAFWLQFGTPLLRRTPAETILLWLGGGALLVSAPTMLALRVRRKRGAPPSSGAELGTKNAVS